jgi:hypothetical protein
MFVLKRKQKFIVIIGLIAVLFVVALCLFYNLVIVSDKSLSPTKEYQVSYNRLSHTITRVQFSTGAKWYEAECYSPEFFWSPDGKYLAANISYPNGNRRLKIWDLEHSVSYTAPTKADIQAAFAETQTQNQDDNAHIEIRDWLHTSFGDSRLVVVDFSWPADEQGKSIVGSCVYDFISRTFSDLTIAE